MGSCSSPECSVEWKATDAPRIDRNEESYTAAKLGRGELAIVYLCKHKKNGFQVVKKEYPMTSEKASAIKLRRMTETKEFLPKILKLDLRHDNLVAYWWTLKGSIADCYNVIMEYCEGGSFTSFIEERRYKGKPLDEELVCRYLGNVASGLEFLHEKMIIHRNMRPSNILLSAGHEVAKIADYGEGVLLKDAHMYLNTVTCPIRYRAPEMDQIDPDKVECMYYSFAADVWALGLIIHELATLDLPNCQTPAPRFDSEYVPLNVKYSLKLRSLVSRMLCNSASRRLTCKQIVSEEFISAAVKAAHLEGTIETLYIV